MLHAIAIVVLVSARAKLNFFNSDDDLFLLGFVRLLLRQVLKLAIVDDLAYWRIGVRGYLDEVHAFFARSANSVTRVHDAELFTVLGNHAHLGYANTFVNPYDRRTAKTGTTAASKTCSYCCTSLVKSCEFRVWSFELVPGCNSKPKTRNSQLCVRERARLNQAPRHFLKLCQRHRADVAFQSFPDGDFAFLNFPIAEHEHERDLLHLCVANLGANLVAANIHFDPQTRRPQILRDLLSILVNAIRDWQHGHLDG